MTLAEERSIIWDGGEKGYDSLPDTTNKQNVQEISANEKERAPVTDDRMRKI